MFAAVTEVNDIVFFGKGLPCNLIKIGVVVMGEDPSLRSGGRGGHGSMEKRSVHVGLDVDRK